MSLTYADETAVTIKRAEQRLAEIDAAISEAYAQMSAINGGDGIQEYSIAGSRSVKRAQLESLTSMVERLEKQKAKYEKRVLRLKGWTGRNHADLSGCSSDTPGDVDA